MAVPRVPKVASAGEIRFDDAIDRSDRALLTDMWVNRVGGFNAYDARRYLRDFADDAFVVFDGKIFTSNRLAYAWRVRMLFAAFRFRALLGRPRIEGEVVDAHVEASSQGFDASFLFVRSRAGSIDYVARCRQTLSRKNDRLQFKTFCMDKLPPERWPLAFLRNANGSLQIRYAV